LENRFGQIIVILSSFEEVLDGIGSWIQSEDSFFSAEFRQHQARCKTYSRIAQHLQHRSRAVAQLISETLSLKDQIIAKEQNQSMIQLNKSAIIITVVTLIYLPPSFLTVCVSEANENFELTGPVILWNELLCI
jgi:Mg2+ and Co2+ transporter CorA